MLPLQRLPAGALRRHVGGDEDVLGANQRWVDEDVGHGRRGRRRCQHKDSVSLSSEWWLRLGSGDQGISGSVLTGFGRGCL